MRQVLPLLALLLASAAFATGSAPGGREAPSGVGVTSLAHKPSAWSLAWSDEFDGPAGATPDAAKWTYDLGGDGFGNQELETYCAPGSTVVPCDPSHPNAVMDGRGHLVISAIKNADGQWTSARLKTFGLKDIQYGRVEARMRLPYGPGLWPAFWMLGTNIPAVGWPDSGEIDIMENVPGDVPGGLGDDTIKSTLHGPGYSGVNGYGRTTKFPGGGRVDDDYHVYGTIWSPGKIEFYLDEPSNIFFVASRAGIPAGTKWVYDHPFFLIMNLAVGGSWPKDPTAATPNPAKMMVDYVRVYRRAP